MIKIYIGEHWGFCFLHFTSSSSVKQLVFAKLHVVSILHLSLIHNSSPFQCYAVNFSPLLSESTPYTTLFLHYYLPPLLFHDTQLFSLFSYKTPLPPQLHNSSSCICYMLHSTFSLHLFPSTDQKFKYEKLSHPAYGVAVIGKVTTHRGRKNTAYTPAHHILSVGGGCFVWGGGVWRL